MAKQQYASMIRTLYPEEVLILKTINTNAPDPRIPGCPIQTIEEALKPAPALEDTLQLINFNLIVEPRAPQGHHYTNRFVLTDYGTRVLEEYETQDGPKPAQRQGIKGNDGPATPGQPRGEPMLAIVAGTNPGEGINHATKDGPRGSVIGKGRANSTS